jgi:uncharacterized protein (DUF2267 family)
MSIPKEAVEAAARTLIGEVPTADVMEFTQRALVAAMPHLRPAPSQSSDDAWLRICQEVGTTTEMIRGEVRQAVIAALDEAEQTGQE